MKPTGMTFSASAKFFSLEKTFCRDSFGVHSAQGEFKVAIRFKRNRWRITFVRNAGTIRSSLSNARTAAWNYA